MFFKLFLFLFISSIFSESKVKLESIELEQFPLVHLNVTENKLKPIQGENISIIESKDGISKNIHSFAILKKNSLRPVKLFLSIQATEDQKKLEYIKQMCVLLIQSLSKDDRVGIHLFGNETYFLNANLSKQEAILKLETALSGKGNRIVTSLNFLLSQISENDLPSLVLVFAVDPPTKDDEKLATLIEKSRKQNQAIHFYSSDEEKFLAISEYTGGEYFPFDKNKSVTEIQSKLYEFRKSLPVLEYKSQFLESANLFRKAKIEVQLKVGKSEVKSKYDLTAYHFIKSKFSNVEFFYTFMFVILFFCLVILYIVSEQIRRKKIEEELRLQEEELLKNDLYYHENLLTEEETFSSFDNYTTRDEEDLETNNFNNTMYNYTPVAETSSKSLTLEIDEFSASEKYDRGVLIIKEGPNPGRQFTVNKDEVTIGNSASNDLVLLDNSVSPMHAKIRKVKNVFILFDTVSKAGVILNGSKLLRPKPLFDFDEIKLGKITLLFRGK